MIKTSTLPNKYKSRPLKNKKTATKAEKFQFCPSDAIISTLLNYSKSLKVVQLNTIGIVDNLLN